MKRAVTKYTMVSNFDSHSYKYDERHKRNTDIIVITKAHYDSSVEMFK